MASSSLILISKTVIYQIQSFSLPSRSHPLIPQFFSLPSRSHPLIPQLNKHLCREKIEESLKGLGDLYDSVDGHFLLISHTQEQGHGKWVDEALDGYLGLLDVCATTKDVLSQSRQDLQQLQSILRRRRDSNDLEGYISSRNNAKKVAQKSLKDLKVIKLKQTLLALDDDQEFMAIVSMSNEAEAVTLAVLEALLSYVTGTTRPRSWSMVMKLLNKIKIASPDINVFESVKGELPSLVALENLKDHLGGMEASIKVLEEGLDCMFRHLLKIRVSLLNFPNS